MRLTFFHQNLNFFLRDNDTLYAAEDEEVFLGKAFQVFIPFFTDIQKLLFFICTAKDRQVEMSSDFFMWT